MFRNLRNFIHNVRYGWLSVLIFYVALTVLAFAAYYYLAKLPEAKGLMSPGDLWAFRGNPLEGLRRVWFIFAWGFGIQLLIQIYRVFRRRPRDAGMGLLLKHGMWISANAGLFEEIIFRLYAFLSLIIGLHWLTGQTGTWLKTAATQAILPAANFLTFSQFHQAFAAHDWAVGIAVIIGGLFFRSAHIHYGKLSKANVWVVGMIMFWLVFNYGLVTAILAHFLYDFAVFAAIALSAPLQPRAPAEE
jgi:hypothetical protein